MRSYIKFVIRRRVGVLLMFVLITAVSAFSMSRGVIASSMRNFLGESSRYEEYLKLAREFSNDEVIIVGYDDDAPLSGPSLDRLAKVVKELSALPGVWRVHSILETPDIAVSNGMISFDSCADEARDDPGRAPELLARLEADPFAGGLLISRDGRHSLVMMELLPDQDRRTEDYPDFIERIIGVFESAGFDAADLHRTGFIPVIAEIMRQTYLNISRLFPVVCVLLPATVFVMFRRLWPVVVTGIIALLAVIWTMGFALFLFHEVNLIMGMVPIFVMVISFSDVVHLCSSYLLELSEGAEKGAAIEKSGSEVGAACFYTSLTTFVGFVSLALVPTPISRQAGVALGFGAAVALLIALTLTPVLFSLMPAPKPWRVGAASTIQDYLDAALSRIAALTRKRPWLIVGAFSILAAASIMGLPRFEFELNFVERFAPQNRLRVDERWFSEHFIGTNYLDVFVEAPEPGGLLAPATFKKIAAYQNALQELPEVDRVMSAVDLIRTMHSKFHPDGAALPDDKKTLAQYLLLFEDSADLDRMMDFDRTRMRLAVHIKEDGVMATQKAGSKAAELGRELLGQDARARVLGLFYLLGDEFDGIIDAQKLALMFSFFAISLMMAIALRSVSAGLWSMVPNVIPLLALTGCIGWFWRYVDTDVIIVLLVAIGIGVDDTIHFLMRFRFESARTDDVNEALDRTFHYSGRAIIITSVILVVGFAPFAFSDYLTTHMIGTLLPACLVMALLADLLLVPALTRLGLFRFKKTGRV